MSSLSAVAVVSVIHITDCHCRTSHCRRRRLHNLIRIRIAVAYGFIERAH
jgi:hypothetical protein